MNIDEYSKRILEPAIKRYFENGQIVQEIIKFEEFYQPPTKWERFKDRMRDYRQRIKDIWTILKGDNVHKDCC